MSDIPENTSNTPNKTDKAARDAELQELTNGTYAAGVVPERVDKPIQTVPTKEQHEALSGGTIPEPAPDTNHSHSHDHANCTHHTQSTGELKTKWLGMLEEGTNKLTERGKFSLGLAGIAAVGVIGAKMLSGKDEPQRANDNSQQAWAARMEQRTSSNPQRAMA